jgi:hypothetical protein
MNITLKTIASAALLAASAAAQFSCPDDSTLSGVASNVSGSADKVLTLSITGTDKIFDLRVEKQHKDAEGHISWEIIETVHFTENNCPPVTIPPGCRASIVDSDTDNTASVDGTAHLT